MDITYVVTKHPANDHFKRLHNKTGETPIQTAEGYSFAAMKRLLLSQVIDDGVDNEKEGNVISYSERHMFSLFVIKEVPTQL